MTPLSIPVPWAADSTIAWLYILTNAARVFTYVPQLMAVWRSEDGARDIALFTWGSWVVANATAVAYGALVVYDLFFTLIAMLNLVCCAAVTVVAALRRRVFRAAASGAPSSQQPPPRNRSSRTASVCGPWQPTRARHSRGESVPLTARSPIGPVG